MAMASPRSPRVLLPICSLVTLLLMLPSMAWAQNAQASPPVEATAPATQLTPPPIPDGSASAAVLEEQGDELRAQKRYLDSIDYYNTAMKKQPSALLWNKEGMSYLLLQRPDKAAKCFDHAIKMDKHAAESYNNRGYVEQMKRKYDKAISYYKKAVELRPGDAVFYYNMGSSYFGMHDYANAGKSYRQAFALDPGIFTRVSRTGIMAQATSPEDRAAFSFLVAKMYAQAGDFDRSLEYLRKAIEDGYKHINDVYKDSEFATLRTDKRFEVLMAQRPQSIP
ncbi:MAG: tetratricopeptide repeat protein [Candidatus Korobacteraceae bacterium]